MATLMMCQRCKEDVPIKEIVQTEGKIICLKCYNFIIEDKEKNEIKT